MQTNKSTTIAVIGLGIMGPGIALEFARPDTR